MALADDVPAMRAGDTLTASVVVDGLYNSSSGKVLAMSCAVNRNGLLVGKFMVEFLYRGHFVDSTAAFKRNHDQWLTILLPTSTDVAILETKDWFCYRKDSRARLQPNMVYSVCLSSEYLFAKDSRFFSSIKVSGSIWAAPHCSNRAIIADIDFQWSTATENPVLEFLNRFQANVDTFMFSDGGRPLISSSNQHLAQITAPESNLNYGHLSGDANPIHFNPYIADYAGNPDTITHGLWTSAATRSVVERILVAGHPERIRTHKAEFVAMVSPRESLQVELFHVGMKSGRMLIKSQASKADGTTAIKCLTEVDQPLTAYIFTGQGSQKIGMGMELYSQSSAARQIWDQANQHMLATYGVRLLEIVQRNPTRYTVSFRGRTGGLILQNYLACGHSDLLPGLSAESLSYTFQASAGLLNATQFTQVALVAAAVAAVEDMRSLSLIQKHSFFAGHSLGELCALSALTDVFTLEDILDVVFYRGLIMQSAVQRDKHGSSGYGMIAVNPSRISAAFKEWMLENIIDIICAVSPGLLQVVNYNVRNYQYAVSGTLLNLAILRNVLDSMCNSGIVSEPGFESYVRQAVDAVLRSTVNVQPVRGKASIPLPGIDVPFHSRLLLRGVPQFRSVLQAKVKCSPSAIKAMCLRYIPNLTAKPFEISREYFELVFGITRSTIIKDVLENWDSSKLHSRELHLGTTLLVELLSYQLASPVQWINTQDQLFVAAQVQRVVEIGPSPVLCGMASKSLSGLPIDIEHPAILHIENDHKMVYYDTPVVQDAQDEAASQQQVPPPVNEKQGPPLQAADNAVSNPESGLEPVKAMSEAAQITDEPIPVVDVVQAIVSYKIKKPLAEISAQQSIKTLVAGKSILQNEILGDLQKEFGSQLPDKAEELAISELAAAMGKTAGALGGCSQQLVSRMLASRMPAGYTLSRIRKVLSNSYGLEIQRQDSLLLVALCMEPSARFASESEAGAWLDQVAQMYASRAGISYTAALKSADVARAALSRPSISDADMQHIRQREIAHVQRKISELADYAALDLRKDARDADARKQQASKLQTQLDGILDELGDDFTTGIIPRFDVRKVRRFDSCWNWVRQDAYKWLQKLICNKSCWSALDTDCKIHLHRLQNGATEELVKFLEGIGRSLRTANGEGLESIARIVNEWHAMCQQAQAKSPTYFENSIPTQPQTFISAEGKVSYSECARSDTPDYSHYVEAIQQTSAASHWPLVHMRELDRAKRWTYSQPLSESYFSALADICCRGISYAGMTALVTGCGHGSIGAEIIRGLLMGGARVIATTSSYSLKTIREFEDKYRGLGSRGSELVVVPFNQGSSQDIHRLVDYIFNDNGGGLGWDLDLVFPFAAVSDIGSMATNLGSRSELAQRVMLTNVVRLLGSIKSAKLKHQYVGSPALVVLPLSPNHGNFGGDGLYGECKIALETMLNRWYSEEWEGYLSVIGAVIGWTRGTALMSATNLVAQKVESYGVRTFSTREMAFNILGLLHPQISCIAHQQPIWADLSGGLNGVDQLSKIVADERARIDTRSRILRASVQAVALDLPGLYGANAFGAKIFQESTPKTTFTNSFPETKSYQSLSHLHSLQGMVNLDKVVVVTGYGEVGPQGNAETRWELEAHGSLSVEGCITLAWIMGLIRHHNGTLPSSETHYIGWVDAKSQEPVQDADVKARYEEYILAHTGIRFVEPQLAGGYDPTQKVLLREVAIEHDMEPFEASSSEAAEFKRSNGDKADIWESVGGEWFVRLLKGAAIHVPLATTTDRLVAALLPTGWDATTFGIPKHIDEQIDPITLYTLVATVEALVRSGITDPYELYQHFHVSEVGNSIGSTGGGMQAVKDIYSRRSLNEAVSADALQETFVSTIQAWVNMLLMSGSGPVKPPVGACATAVVSIDLAVEAIQSGKAQVMLAGGVDDFSETSATEFENMGATSNSRHGLASGREPSEMSRPCTSTRDGFVEGQGSGVAVLMSATAAIRIGAPIYGVVAMSGTATDKQGSSVPAPGKGVLTSARELNSSRKSWMLDLKYRRRMLERQLQTLSMWKQNELDEEYDSDDSGVEVSSTLTSEARIRDIKNAYLRQRKALQDVWGNEFWKQDTEISPLRGSLAVWGLTANDIGMASFHGTSTKANDKNESEVLNAQLEHLGRIPGHAVPVVCQKWITGHSKGAAGAFMLNGVLQSLRTGLVPGNRNADNIDQELSKYSHLLYLSETIQTAGIKAVLMKSFGFGQVGGELLVLHPDFVLATLEQEQLEEYNCKLEQRSIKSHRYWQDAMINKHPFVQIKDHPPYTPDQEHDVYLNPLARARPTAQGYRFA
ncbi:fatty acid synthase alpha subunit Lsd1 [Coemansia sp. RSA 2336]|nr:fatty acid synthase alpha subunit Lsd1 [Coemansia sp. RSA 2336]